METFGYFHRIFFLTLVLGLLAAGTVCAQTTANPLKLYAEETDRLKQQKATLTAENEAFKQALEAENKRATQLQSDLDHLQSTITERDNGLNKLSSDLNIANKRVAQWQRLALLLAWSIVLFLAGLLAYYQRAALQRQLIKLMEQLLKFIESCMARIGAAANHTSRRPVRLTEPINESESVIRPEEITERLYGRHR